MFIAEELREIMAKLGFRTLDEMIGRSDLLDTGQAIDHYKAKGLDFSRIFYRPEMGPEVAVRRVRGAGPRTARGAGPGAAEAPPHPGHPGAALSRSPGARPSRTEGGREIPSATEVELPTADIKMQIRNVNRTVGAILGSHVTRKFGPEGLPEDTIRLNFHGSAGQSFGAFVPHGLTLTLEGDAQDYCGKGLSGGKVVVFPPRQSTFVPEQNILIGNVALYGATSGKAFFRGKAESVSACATRARTPWWKGPATTAAST